MIPLFGGSSLFQLHCQSHKRGPCFPGFRNLRPTSLHESNTVPYGNLECSEKLCFNSDKAQAAFSFEEQNAAHGLGQMAIGDMNGLMDKLSMNGITQNQCSKLLRF